MCKAFVNLDIRPIMLFRRQCFLQEVFARFYFLVMVMVYCFIWLSQQAEAP